jgi:hypothetical protein
LLARQPLRRATDHPIEIASMSRPVGGGSSANARPAPVSVNTPSANWALARSR